MKPLILVVLALVCASPAQAQQATLVSADTGGMFYARGTDTLFARNTTWASRDSASALPDCVYSGASRRMLARDSMRLTITDARGTVWWDVVLRPNATIKPQVTLALPHTVMHILDVSAPASVCGVNAGQLWFHWRIERPRIERRGGGAS